MNDAKLAISAGILDCEHDATNLERGLQDFKGIIDLKVYPKSAKVSLRYNAASTSPELLREKLEQVGLPPRQRRKTTQQLKPWQNPKVVTSLITGLLLLVGGLLERAGVADPVAVLLYFGAMLGGGYYFGRGALEELLYEREISIELLSFTPLR